ncbi:hypothetical protein CARUB_v10027820mg [Capsella rubella]|uniref:F-box domain-containing protein n=1 Tax=Capsella rubella TaxID=81985 RepID=R0GD25_9BRAS|nr:hypothetical protein CARUB_v10027820mg [Capsella rubella]
MTTMCDLPPELVGMIFTKIPITSIRTVRSTCRYWKALTKDWVLGKGAAREQFLGFMTMDSKVCLLRFKNNCKEDGDSLDLSIKQVDLLNQVDISKVFYCDGLVLCVAKDNSRLMVWNPYLGQTRWIEPRTEFHTLYTYALGYDINRNHKILKFMDSEGFEKKDFFGYEIYDFNSNSWRVLDGNSYFFAQEKIGHYVVSSGLIIAPNLSTVSDFKDFLLCFDFTKERFGPRLPLPFHSKIGEYVALSCVKEEQLAVLYQRMKHNCSPILYIWVTTRIEPNTLSWSKFLRVEMRPFELSGSFGVNAESFFVDEEEKVVVVFDCDLYLRTKTIRHHKSFIIGEGGYFKSVNLGEAPYIEETCPMLGYTKQIYRPPLVCSSSYFPSLVQLNQSRKRKEGDNN